MTMKLLILNLIVSFTLVCCSKEPVIEIDNGKLLGLTQPNYYSFYGILYAEPPVGDLRFESPRPFNQKWSNIRDVQKKPQPCVQWDMFELDGDTLIGDEDCLFLNVHTPDYETKELYPVIFYIHGGGFIFGNGNLESEKYIMRDTKMIYVSFNYRLGQLGFLSTGDDQISGNMGLKDQHLALKWVKANIQKFGGDPNRILMAGFSAGAGSVDYQLLKPETENLVKAALSLSGSSLNTWALCKEPKQHAIKLAKLLNCPTDTSGEIKTCLQNKTALDLMLKLKEFRNFLDTSIGIFAPVLESKSVSDPFITKSPRTILSEGKIANVPWMVSFTSEDAGFFTGVILRLIEEKAPENIIYDFKTFERYKNKYSDDFYQNLIKEVKEGDFKKMTQYFTDHTFKNEIVEALNLRANYSKSSTYTFIYDNAPEQNIANLMSNRTDIKFGTVHGDDVFLMFQSDVREAFPIRDDEKLISKKLIKMLESFIVNGKPIYDDVELPENKPGANEIQYMKIKKDKVKIKKFTNIKVNKTELYR